MGSKEPPPTVSEWIKFPWEQSAESGSAIPTNEEVERLRQMLREENEKAGAK